MAWVAVTKTGIETMFRNCPMRYRGFWIDEQELKFFNECFKYKHEIDEDFKYIKVYYHTWEGKDIVKHYIQHSIKIPYTLIID